MSDKTRSFTFTQTVPAAPDAVYAALTNGTTLRNWFCDMATTVPREGGRIYLAWDDGYYSSGTFTRLEPGETVAYRWHGPAEPAPSQVTISLSAEEAGTAVRVLHDEVGTGAAWEEFGDSLQKAWPAGLENLASIFSSGEDLRFTRRPMLGITVGEFNADIAEELEVPATEGIRLDSVLPEMGAGAAGLQEGDVIVALGGAAVRDWPSLGSALQAHQAGDEVEVVYYRGSERRTLAMTLSGRPLPEIPESVEALAAEARRRYEQIDQELAAFFSGVGEEEAAHKPAPGEWSAREVLAHLIQGERGWQNWMGEIVSGHEAWYDDWGGNVPARIAATDAVHESAQEMLATLQRLNRETVAFVENLPPAFPEQQKARFWRIAYPILQEPFHHRDHLAQMEAAVADAR